MHGAPAHLGDAEEVVILDDDQDGTALPDLDEVAPADPAPRRPVPTPLLARLLSYAQGRLAAGIGSEDVQAAGLSVPAFVDVFAPGYIPANYLQAIAPAEAALLGDLDLVGTLVIPAFDLQGTLADLAIWRLADVLTYVGSLQPEPVGAFASRIVSVAREVVLVSDLPDLCRRLAAGERHVHLLRSDISVDAQIRDLQARGLKAVRVDDPQLSAVCTGLGVTITADTSEAGWAFVSFERDHRRALYRRGIVVASLLIPAPGSTKLRVDLRLPDGRNQGDTFDVAVPRQVQAFTAMASRKLHVEAAALLDLFDAGLLDRLRALEDDDQPQAARPVASEPADVEACGIDPALVDRFVRDAEVLGWVGDDQAKVLALLTLAGLGLDHPPWVLLRGSSAVTLPITGILADLLPAQRRLHLSRVVEGSLTNQGPDGLRHRLLVVDEAEAVKPATITTLRVLQARGGIALPISARDAATGRMVSRLTEARGPVGLIAASAEPCNLDELAVVVRLDDSPAQTARVLAASCQALRDGIDHAARARVLARWQAILAGLPRLPVRVPAAARVVFPSRHPRHQAEQRWFFALVEASALLHHRQRPQVDGCVIATEVDIDLVIRATCGVLGRTDDGLSDRAQQVIGLLATRPGRAITTPQLIEVCPHWSRDVARNVLDELLRAQLLTSPSTGRGRHARTFTLVAEVHPEAPTIRLLPAGEVAQRGWELGEAPNSFPNIFPAQAVG